MYYLYGGFLKWWFHYKPFIWGTLILGNPHINRQIEYIIYIIYIIYIYIIYICIIQYIYGIYIDYNIIYI
jgi:hypothetical protein